MSYAKISQILPKILTNHFGQSLLNKHVLHAIGYGSGVFPQTNQKNISNTVDIILIVKESYNFHALLMENKRDDYAGLPKIFGASYLNTLNKYIFPAHFNHIVLKQQNVKLKYCVVEQDTIFRDLNTWNLLTFAGRLQKPVLLNILQSKNTLKFNECLQKNRQMALKVGLLGLIGKVKDNQAVKLKQLYKSISNISYAGDIRYTVPVQNKSKVENIVVNNKQYFDDIYLPILDKVSKRTQNKAIEVQNSNQFKIRFTPQLIQVLIQEQPFPQVLKQYFMQQNNIGQKQITKKILLNGLALLPKQIDQVLAKVNRNSSVRMAIQNLLGASLVHNVKYILAKIKKKLTK